jgi:hypothetical protein
MKAAQCQRAVASGGQAKRGARDVGHANHRVPQHRSKALRVRRWTWRESISECVPMGRLNARSRGSNMQGIGRNAGRLEQVILAEHVVEQD